jgi:hypothetical protein
MATADGSVTIVTLDRAALAPILVRPPRSATLQSRWLSPLALADLDGNGTLEILVASETALHALSATGAELQGWPYPFRLDPALEREPEPGRGAGSPLVADLDGDGTVEIALHLPGGAWLVWSPNAERRRDLEAALPARAEFTPLLADLDGQPGAELAAFGRFDAATRYLAAPDSLVTTPVTEIGVWMLPHAGRVAWGELGGGPGHAFLDASERQVTPSANDSALPSFVVGPNPAANELRARIVLTEAATVHCQLFNLEGELVAEGSRAGSAGTLVEIPLAVSRLAPGIYLAQLDLSTGGRRTRPVAIRR